MVKFGHPSLLGEPPLPVCANRLAGFLFVSECGKIKLDSWTLSFAILSYPLCPWRQCETPGAFLFVCPPPSPAAGGLFLMPAEQREQKEQIFFATFSARKQNRRNKGNRFFATFSVWRLSHGEQILFCSSFCSAICSPKKRVFMRVFGMWKQKQQIFLYIEKSRKNNTYMSARARRMCARVYMLKNASVAVFCCLCRYSVTFYSKMRQQILFVLPCVADT